MQNRERRKHLESTFLMNHFHISVLRPQRSTLVSVSLRLAMNMSHRNLLQKNQTIPLGVWMQKCSMGFVRDVAFCWQVFCLWITRIRSLC